MSSRTRDLLSATMMSAGIYFASELHGVYTTGTTGEDAAAQDYWVDWFDNDRWHSSPTTGLTQCSSGRHEVLILLPGTHNLSTNWDYGKGNTHMVGMQSGQGQLVTSPVIAMTEKTVTAMITVNSTGVTFANFQMYHGSSTGDKDSICALRVTSGKGGFAARNVYFRGPINNEQGESTGDPGYRMVDIGGKYCYFENCLFGGGDDGVMGSAPAGNEDVPVLVRTAKSACSAHFRDCNFVLRAAAVNQAHFLGIRGYPWGGTFHIFQNCAFLNIGSGTLTAGIGYGGGGGGYGNATQNGAAAYFDANCRFAGCTYVVAHDGMEAAIWFADAIDSTGSSNKLLVGKARNPDMA